MRQHHNPKSNKVLFITKTVYISVESGAAGAEDKDKPEQSQGQDGEGDEGGGEGGGEWGGEGGDQP